MFNKIKAKRIYKRLKEGKITYSSMFSYDETIDSVDIGRTRIYDMKNGKRGVYKIVDCTECDKYGSKDIKLMFIRYVGEKDVINMDFETFYNGEYWKLFIYNR